MSLAIFILSAMCMGALKWILPFLLLIESILDSTGLREAQSPVRVRILINCRHPPSLHPREPLDSLG